MEFDGCNGIYWNLIKFHEFNEIYWNLAEFNGFNEIQRNLMKLTHTLPTQDRFETK